MPSLIKNAVSSLMIDMPPSTERRKLRRFEAVEARRGNGRLCAELFESNRGKDDFNPEELREETLAGYRDLG